MRTASNKRVELEMTFVSLFVPSRCPKERRRRVLPQKEFDRKFEKAEPDPIFEETKKEHKEQKEQADGISFAEEAADKYRFTDEDAPPGRSRAKKVEIPEKASHMPPERPPEPKAPEITEERRPAPPAFDAAFGAEIRRECADRTRRVVRFDKWPEVLRALSDINRMMSATLRAARPISRAKNLLLIKSGTPCFSSLLEKSRKTKTTFARPL